VSDVSDEEKVNDMRAHTNLSIVYLPINCSYFIFALGLRRIDPGGIDPM
jgi:hypothetical protein